ncbi:NAD(P)/FAD-dependent oxidoreductase [Mycobacterium sp. 29Ha]|uniref:flavin-containing monooxygenase n=1 Tax=Mycobacterium sp. 29Ha TaxID=2939268 RepID=UPI00293917DD|nr:NAD(P)/FAD-dependent oxidoreductase [Mycobacterium sp. 29Ha]MDV3133246.1 NAD(P)/FAD-dependent oxidoreductase [Mycobacterium sp. 29Ha]
MSEFFDVVVIGAGISGISAAWHLQDRCPDKSYLVLERRADLGGTWDLFKYPGIRSDSDMCTFGFRFKPWHSARFTVDAATIKSYLWEAATESGIDRHIRFGTQVLSADWSDAERRWTVKVVRDGEEREIGAAFLFVCSGYYDYDKGYCPEFQGEKDFEGTIVHPQHWPEDLDYGGNRIVVIGSGATAVTLIPSLIDSGAGHVTMLQRSPTYIASLPNIDPVAVQLIKWLPPGAADFINRWKNILLAVAQYQLARRFPSPMRKGLIAWAKHQLPAGYDVDKHFGPKYNPWDERVCLAPNGDIFKAVRDGKADVVTDTIDRFTKTGIKLSSGHELAADIIVTATGLNMRLFGGATLSRNGQAVDVAKSMTYKAMMLSDVPNMAFTIGYINASWTLKADLVSEYVCCLLNYMDEHGYDTVVAPHPGGDVEELPFTDFAPGYFRRAMHQLPKSGSRGPWKAKQNYLSDLRRIRRRNNIVDGLHFTKKAPGRDETLRRLVPGGVPEGLAADLPGQIAQ